MMNWIKATLIAAYAVFAPIHQVLLVTGTLIILDLIMGIWAAHKRGEPIKSSELRRTVTKMLLFHLVLISAFLIEKYMLDGLVPIVKLASSAIGLTEAKSIYENAEDVYGKPIFRTLIKQLGSKNEGGGK